MGNKKIGSVTTDYGYLNQARNHLNLLTTQESHSKLKGLRKNFATAAIIALASGTTLLFSTHTVKADETNDATVQKNDQCLPAGEEFPVYLPQNAQREGPAILLLSFLPVKRGRSVFRSRSASAHAEKWQYSARMEAGRSDRKVLSAHIRRDWSWQKLLFR